MITVAGVQSRIHATIFRGAAGKFYYRPHCTLCTNAFGNAREFDGGLCFSAAFICDPCVERHANDNLALATGGTSSWKVSETGAPVKVSAEWVEKNTTPTNPAPVTRKRGKR